MSAQRQKKFSTIEVARLLGVAVSSVSRWIDEGKLVAGRTPGGHRRTECEDLIQFLRQQGLRIPTELEPCRPKILIVDDEKSFVTLLSEEIQGRFPDCELLIANDGYSAGEIIGLSKPAVVILDLHLPGIDGFEVCRRIKSNPLLKNTRVIAVTADTSAEASAHILRLGATACMSKPLDYAALCSALSMSLADAAKTASRT